MTSTASTTRTAGDGLRAAFGIGGILAVVLGVLVLVWPGRTAMIVTAMIAAYALVAGLIYAGVGIFAGGKGGWARVGQIVLGVLFVVAAVIAFANLSQTTVWLAVFLGILVGILWVLEGFVALSTLGGSGSKAWSVLYAVLSIIAGVVLLFSPLWGAAVLWWLLGISFIVLGITGVIRGFTQGR